MRQSSHRGRSVSKNKVSYWVAVIAVLTGAASTGQAITLGDLRGNAVIGRTLDVSVPVLPSPGEELAASCLSAEVLLGDVQRLSASVTVSPVTSGPASMNMVRIRSAAAVDEPVVTVVLRSTCGGLTTRQYVLLSDFPVAALPRVAAAPGAGSKSAGASDALTALQPAQAGDGLPALDATGLAEQSGRSVSQAAAPVKKRPKPRPIVKPVPPPAPPEPESAKPVLKLDATPVLPVQPQAPASAAQPALAAAAAPSDEAAQQLARIEALQADIKVLKDLAIKNEATLVDLQSKLRQAEAERVPMTWLYLLGGLLIASLGALTWVLRRQQAATKRDEVWWQQVNDDPSETLVVAPPSTRQPDAPLSVFGETSQHVEPVAPMAPAPTPPPLDIDLDIDLNSLSPVETAFADSEPLAVLPVDRSSTLNNLNGDGISDIRQQAEFFVSLGQTERAMNVLRKQVMESPQPNPLVYLDLLAMYHSQGMKTDFRELRAAFGRFFNGVVPDFAAFNLAGNDLLDYPEPLAVLVRFWPNIEAIAFLEACIFRNEAAPMQLSFDLAAFRDLLMLHAVAENVTSDSPWKMTHHEALGDINTGPAEWAGLAMMMDMRGKAEG